MKVLIAPDSFKGTLSSPEVIDIVASAAKKIFPDAELSSLPIADGGEGTAGALLAAVGGKACKALITGPMGNQVQSEYIVLKNGIAVIEMAQASGITQVAPEEKNPLKATSYGTGELIALALSSGIRNIVIAIGGSATNDGGMGAMNALGIRFYDKEGKELFGCGEALEKVASVDMSTLHPGVKEAAFSVICDVDNPLIGPDGATYIYGPQKGATSDRLERLEKGMCNYRDCVNRCLSSCFDTVPGAGAAGGMGYALSAFLGAELKRGIEVVLDTVKFDDLITDVDLVVTGEGRIDEQSVRFGKVPTGILKRCSRKGVPVAILAGGMGKNAEKIFEIGEASIMTSVNAIMPLDAALTDAKALLFGAAERTFRLVRIGMNISKQERA